MEELPNIPSITQVHKAIEEIRALLAELSVDETVPRRAPRHKPRFGPALWRLLVHAHHAQLMPGLELFRTRTPLPGSSRVAEVLALHYSPTAARSMSPIRLDGYLDVVHEQVVEWFLDEAAAAFLETTWVRYTRATLAVVLTDILSLRSTQTIAKMTCDTVPGERTTWSAVFHRERSPHLRHCAVMARLLRARSDKLRPCRFDVVDDPTALLEDYIEAVVLHGQRLEPRVRQGVTDLLKELTPIPRDTRRPRRPS